VRPPATRILGRETPMLQTVMIFAVLATSFSTAMAQEPASEPPTETPAEPSLQDRGEQIAHETKDRVEDFAKQVDDSSEAAEIKTSLLNPIYRLAEFMAFPTFHWLAFSVMVAGVVSFALQLVLAKLILLTRLGITLTSIFSDALGLIISVIGLVLTTQAATENSSFTESSAAVLSSAIVGALFGFIFYWWGQREELQAAKGRSQLDV
jgi:hypothetical protein